MKNIFLLITFCSFATSIKAQRVKDSIAIRLLLEKESATWRSKDR